MSWFSWCISRLETRGVKKTFETVKSLASSKKSETWNPTKVVKTGFSYNGQKSEKIGKKKTPNPFISIWYFFLNNSPKKITIQNNQLGGPFCHDPKPLTSISRGSPGRKMRDMVKLPVDDSSTTSKAVFFVYHFIFPGAHQKKNGTCFLWFFFFS